MTLIELLVLTILITLLCGVLLFFYTLYQVMVYIDKIELYNGGDIIGIGDINPDTTKENTVTTSTTEKISPNTPDTVYKRLKRNKLNK